MATFRSGTVNVKSCLLSDEENEAVFSSLGTKCLTLCTTLAELSQASDDKRDTWKKIYSGVVCFVKDFLMRSYFIRLYDQESKAMLWEHDTRLRTPQLDYSSTSDGLLTIIVNDHKLTFSDKEGVNFKAAVEEKLAVRQKRRRARAGLPSPPNRLSGDINTLNSKGSKKEKRKLSEGIEKSDLEIRQLFQQIGINDLQQLDKETIDFIFDFVDKHGGLDTVKQDLECRQTTMAPPPIPSRAIILPPPPHPSANRKVNPPPPRDRVRIPPPPPSANRGVMPPLPPRDRLRIPPPPPSANRGVMPPPPPRDRVRIPPPPPSANRRVGPPPPPSKTGNNPPPPPANLSLVPAPPPSGKQGEPPLHQSETEDKASCQPSSREATSIQPTSPNTTSQEASTDNSLREQLMQLLLQNPSEMTDLICNIMENKGDLQDIKDKLAKRKSQSDPVKENDDQVPGKTSFNSISDGVSNIALDDAVPGRMASDQISGGETCWTFDYEVGSDMIDDDDDEWND